MARYAGMKSTTNKVSFATLLLLGIGMFLNAETASALEWRIPLAPTPQYAGAKAKAKYKAVGGEREFQVEAENLWRLRGTAVSVHVNGAFVGRMRINNFGNGRFSRNTNLGQPVPNIVRGSVIVIRRADGPKIFGGRF
jgi:hypothetical protein